MSEIRKDKLSLNNFDTLTALSRGGGGGGRRPLFSFGGSTKFLFWQQRRWWIGSRAGSGPAGRGEWRNTGGGTAASWYSTRKVYPTPGDLFVSMRPAVEIEILRLIIFES